MLDHELLHQKVGALADYCRELTPEHTPKNAELWRELWALSLDIFESFKTVMFPTKEEKDADWQAYNEIKNTANSLKQQMDERLFIDIDANIAHLELLVAAFSEPTKNSSFQAIQADYEPIMQLAEHTKSLMRGVRFSNKEEREAKYDRVQQLQTETKDYRRILLGATSEIAFNSLAQKIKACKHDPKKDVFYTEPSFDGLKIASENMKRRQADLRDVISEFSLLKVEMNADDKGKVIVLLDEVRATHNAFWEVHHIAFEDLKKAKDKEYADKHQVYLSKQEAFKARLADNIKRNQERLFKATEFRNKQEEQIISLKNKLVDTESGIYADRLNSWLAEAEKKVQEGNEQIERLKKFIEEDNLKLEEVNSRD
ncbi:MAG: hypothetical protein RI894_2261 [Bacteroidota bacterium]|jgi:hypothetical protein